MSIDKPKDFLDDKSPEIIEKISVSDAIEELPTPFVEPAIPAIPGYDQETGAFHI